MKLPNLTHLLRGCALIALAFSPGAAHAVLISSGNGNTSAPADDPGFANIGRSSSGNASVTYLGNGWCITAFHVTISNDSGPIRFGLQEYGIDTQSIYQLHSSDNSLADLKIFQLTGEIVGGNVIHNQFPSLPSLNIAQNPAVGGGDPDELIMVGNGLSQSTGQIDWNASWQQTPPNSGPAAHSGFEALGNRVIRWGENLVFQAGLFRNNGIGTYNYFSTRFDDEEWTGIAGLEHEAQGIPGDSGGGVFRKTAGGDWELLGIIIEQIPLGGQPAGLAPFGNRTFIADLSFYRNEILQVPEPSSISMALIGAWAAFGFYALQRRRAAVRGRF